MRKQIGFSLLELLISLALGVILMAFVGKIFISVQNMNRFINDEIFLQENMRLAQQALGKAIRSAGYQPYPLPIVSIDDALHVQHQADGNDAIIINHSEKYEIKNSAYPVNKATNSLYNSIELVPGIDGLHVTMIKSEQGKPLIKINLHMTAPYGMTRTMLSTFALREYVS